MSVIKNMRRQKAVWWVRSETPNEFGVYAFGAPVEIKCRWDDQFVEYTNSQGEVSVSNSVVYPDRILSVGDRLWLGVLGGETPTDPLTLTDAHSIKRFDKTPNFKATETLYTAFL